MCSNCAIFLQIKSNSRQLMACTCYYLNCTFFAKFKFKTCSEFEHVKNSVLLAQNRFSSSVIALW